MTIHLLKLCVGASVAADLAAWQAHCIAEYGEVCHVTRQTPKRAAELLDGGALYWVIKGWIALRQPILDLRPLERDGATYCGLLLDPRLVAVQPRPKRPFQGWRYLPPADAPPDLGPWRAEQDQSDSLRDDLMAYGIL